MEQDTLLPRLITSQSYLDEEIVQEKIEANDFEVTVSPVFEYEGETYQVILDGHHSFEAAQQTGQEVEWTVATRVTHDTIAVLERNGVESFLEVVCDGDFIDAVTRRTVW